MDKIKDDEKEKQEAEISAFSSADMELIRKLEPVIELLSHPELEKYLLIMTNRKKRLFQSFLIGIARGFGTAIGFTVLGAIAILILQYIVKLNLPFIGDFIAKIVLLVQSNLR